MKREPEFDNKVRTTRLVGDIIPEGTEGIFKGSHPDDFRYAVVVINHEERGIPFDAIEVVEA